MWVYPSELPSVDQHDCPPSGDGINSQPKKTRRVRTMIAVAEQVVAIERYGKRESRDDFGQCNTRRNAFFFSRNLHVIRHRCGAICSDSRILYTYGGFSEM